MTPQALADQFDELFRLLSGSRCGLESMVRRVEGRSPKDRPLDRLRLAASLAEEMSQQSDALVSVFVERARDAGCSWSEIGRALGVSKQAAHERFLERSATSRFTEAARDVIRRAEAEARSLGHAWVTANHLLLALAGDERGAAGRALRFLGASSDRMRSLGSLAAEPEPRTGAVEPAFSPDVIRIVTDYALTAASALGHNYVGAEHLLLGLVSRHQHTVLDDLAIERRALRTRVLEMMSSAPTGDA